MSSREEAYIYTLLEPDAVTTNGNGKRYKPVNILSPVPEDVKELMRRRGKSGDDKISKKEQHDT